MPDIRIQSWNELLNHVYADSWQEPLRRFRSAFAFRGCSRASDDLVTSLARLGDNSSQTEPYILRAFRKYARHDISFFHGDSMWNWLALAQHHGLPTRLLDWTYSPFVALHFATANVREFDRDGVVWCIDYLKANTHLPQSLRKTLEDEAAGVFTAEMLDGVATSLQQFDELPADEPFVIFLEPPSLDERIVNQFALFSLMNSVDARLDKWLANHPELCKRLIIPAELKWEVRDKLDQANITERVLFPGFDGLSRWLSRYYMLRPDSKGS